MALFRYVAMDPSGRTVQDVHEADDEAGLARALKKNGLFLVESVLVQRPSAAAKPAVSTAAKIAAKAKPGARTGKLKPVSAKHIAEFTSQFSLMIRASLPAAEAISSLCEVETNPDFQPILADILERLRKGEPLSRSFAKHPDTFDSIYIGLLTAGEASGTIQDMLTRINEHMTFQIELGQKIRAAMVYPLLVLGASVTVILFLMLVVLPSFVDIFSQFDAKLPVPTRILLGASLFLRHNWWWLAGFLAAGAALFRNWLQEQKNRAQVDTWILMSPIVGPMIQAIILTRILRTLAVLLQAKLPILRSLELAKAAAVNSYFEDLISRVMDDVGKGKGIASALQDARFFPKTVANMIATAERTGKLPEVLRISADYYQKELDNKIETAFAALEPLFIGVLSVVVGGIAVCILLPIMSLGSAVG